MYIEKAVTKGRLKWEGCDGLVLYQRNALKTTALLNLNSAS